MKFKKGQRRPAIVYEKELISYWQKNKTFEKSVEQRPVSNSYVFYDGPPFITGSPHHGTLLSSIAKDAVPRYQTMKGRRVERVWGWDCHGLPAEVFTEKKLGIEDKRDIGTKISLEEYINTCRDNMIQTGNAWEDIIDRVGRWVDFKGAYKTMDKEYMESIWWVFKRLYEEGKIYEGEKVLLYCTRDATPISKAEVAMDNSYQDVTDPSVYVKFQLTDQKAKLLAWTTTPWTLPANTAVAVNKDEDYAEVEVGGEHLIIATELLAKVLTDEKHQSLDYKVLKTMKGGELIGKSYEPLFEGQGKNAHKVWAADYVTLEEGTGIVHLAPAYGEEDYLLAKEVGFPVLSIIDDNGFYTDGRWKGLQVWDSNKLIAKTLLSEGLVWKIDYIKHSYPHCHRCGTRLMYRAHPSWFMDIAGQKKRMLEQNGNINWFPEHIKEGRFAKTIESAPDWNISRDRFWATAMPVWKGIDEKGKEHIKVIGSYAELKELSGIELEDYHRPWVDDVTFEIDGVTYKRIDKVLDGWLESGSMPFAQFHYPFENVEKFENNFPGDFIVEYVGQVRAWFYYLHAVSVGVFAKNSFSNVIVTGTLAGNDGRKMSKSFGNYTDPAELIDKYSADAYRLLMLGSPVLNGEDFALQDKDVADISRKLAMVWNMYDFFTLYADVDGWDSGLAKGVLPTEPDLNTLENPLDEWIISKLHALTKEVDSNMSAYDLPNAVKPIIPFIEDASNWYVRRSRKRFWKSSNDSDKVAAYSTLYYVLTKLAVIIAPFTPFMSEELYRSLTGGESVHLLDWPAEGHINELVVSKMNFVRDVITEGLSVRAKNSIKVRQPLSKVILKNHKMLDMKLDYYYLDIIREELNVKNVEVDQTIDASVSLDLHITDELRREGYAREIIRHIQQARKEAGLEVDDRINLSLVTSHDDLQKVLDDKPLIDEISHETLAVSLTTDPANVELKEVKIAEGVEIRIGLSKA
ncbi:MAG TPA: isoleucine--tRNA ligase [Candidatus Saccharimonadales bacterium]|nr:isoleucine--tRNA ligase [Candidatus Saccharimonadales bacterium]